MATKTGNTGNIKNIEKASYCKPKRYFEKNGAVNPEASFYVPLENVTNQDNQEIQAMVNQGKYFSIFAPRQSGKTTFLEEIRSSLHNDATYVVILLSFERYRSLEAQRFYQEIQKELFPQLLDRLEQVRCDKLAEIQSFLRDHPLTDHISFGELFKQLNRIIQFKKIIIFIDEFDGIPISQLENFLTTLRYLYQQYKRVKQKSLYSVGLVGIRNITKLVVGGVSPFNIADQVAMPPFSRAGIAQLYSQYTGETNQPFTPAAIDSIFAQSGGQTWLVNRLGTILTTHIKPGTVEPIDTGDVEQALKVILKERNSHFDNLYEKARLYKETFIEIVFDHVEYNQYDQEQSWLEQYGLIRNSNGHAVVSNNIYKELFVKSFFKEAKAYDDLSLEPYALSGNRLDMHRILLNFGRYITQIGIKAFYSEKKPYEKTGQFLLTAWLYQFVRNGKDEVRDEVLTGLGRMDIMLTHKNRKYIIETKVNRDSDISGILKEGILQLSEKYMATEETTEGYLVIFDTRTQVGTVHQPQTHQVGKKRIHSFIIPIAYPQ